jgi:hypothetical protein
MNEYVLAANAAILLAEKLIPLIEDGIANGQVSVSDQVMLRGRYESLRSKADVFAAQHWQVEQTPQAPVK